MHFGLSIGCDFYFAFFSWDDMVGKKYCCLTARSSPVQILIRHIPCFLGVSVRLVNMLCDGLATCPSTFIPIGAVDMM